MGDTIPWAGGLYRKKRKLRKCDQLPPIPSSPASVPMPSRWGGLSPQTARQKQAFLPKVVLARALVTATRKVANTGCILFRASGTHWALNEHADENSACQ